MPNDLRRIRLGYISIDWDHLTILFDVIDQWFPELATPFHCLRVAHKHHCVSSSCDSHIQSSLVLHEPNRVELIRPDTVEDNDVFLFSLEGINSVHFRDRLVVVVRNLVPHLSQKKVDLGLVRSNNSNLSF